MKTFTRIPSHIGVIPDGNRRWAVDKGMKKQDGYRHGIDPGFELYKACRDLGVEEMTFYGFTQDNTKRPREQTKAFQDACVQAVRKLVEHDADLLVVGNITSPLFPKELIPYTKRTCMGKGGMKVNFLVNYGWSWDISNWVVGQVQQKRERRFKPFGETNRHKTMNGLNGNKDNVEFADELLHSEPINLYQTIGSSQISRIDLILRWGGRRRLSGFLPMQSVYADFYVIDDMWPDYKEDHLWEALDWYQSQDVTLGG